MLYSYTTFHEISDLVGILKCPNLLELIRYQCDCGTDSTLSTRNQHLTLSDEKNKLTEKHGVDEHVSSCIFNYSRQCTALLKWQKEVETETRFTIYKKLIPAF